MSNLAKNTAQIICNSGDGGSMAEWSACRIRNFQGPRVWVRSEHCLNSLLFHGIAPSSNP